MEEKTSGIQELKIALGSWRIWCSLAFQDIVIRYRGSVLGPFWITISTAITVYSMGFLYGALFHIDRSSYLPYFTTGIISWTFISMVIHESTKIFIDSKHYMENIQLSSLVYIGRLLVRNLIILMHNIPVFISIALLYKMELNLHLLLIFPSLIILCLNAVFYGTLIALVSARFPDVGSIVSSLLQVLFFITPIMWSPSNLPEKFQLYLLMNPFSYFVALIRNPLLGIGFTPSEQIGLCVLTLGGFMVFIPTIRKYIRRVIFWI
ncbi:MAG: ABC transporter permease [Verrucomicrobia bacterium]|nr:ABC transporter permease [Verrucomicrobiota bacterium]MBU6447022.1 ABC transporter permease [Verrucomicrobiota bacterium]MDE3047253.1 ABC transporter permease [Verrucomicrobiota bacterium]